MAVFVCEGCGAALTEPVSRVALPAHAYQKYGHGLLGVLMEPGTYAIDPDASGPPWRPWAEVGAAEAAARGVYAPVYALSYGPRGAVVVAPGDVRGTMFIPERSGGYCCGLDGRDGPNLLLSIGVQGRRGPWWALGMTAPGGVHDGAPIGRVCGSGLSVIDPDEHVVADQPHRQGPAVQDMSMVDLDVEPCLNGLSSR